MNLIATELQEDVMKTRMQPIGNIWNKFPRTCAIWRTVAAKKCAWRWLGRTPS
jgi:two-component system chemotaxis sensor kinase CheA